MTVRYIDTQLHRSASSRHFLTSILLCLGSAVLAAADVAAQPEPRPVTTQAQLFDLDQVRLGEGPFKVAQETDETYLLKLDPDRLLAWYRKEAGLPQKAEVYGGWESLGVAGHTCGHYLSALAQMYASTGKPVYKQRADYIVGELDTCQKALGTGYVAAIPNGKKMFAEIAAGNIRTDNGLNGVWVPWYTIHKEMAGLLDAYHYCHNDEALAVATRLADWIGTEVSNLNNDQMQRMLAVEHGGITESLANLYGFTKNEKYLALAEKFRHDRFFTPFSQGTDVLTGNHANTQIPKFIGYQRVYELTGAPDWGAAADNFWKAVTSNRTWVIGGNSEREFFFAPAAFENQMTDPVGPETCNSYNMLKLTEHIFDEHPDGPVMDYYERTLYNHILSSIRPKQDGFVYYTAMGPGTYRTYSTDFNDFWCCVGTGMENHAKYGKAIYAHEGTDKLLVNLFIASTLDWQEAGVKVEQRTSFPEEQGSTLVFHSAPSKALEIDVRYPSWVAPGALQLSVNGKPQTITARPGQYAAIQGQWKQGDTLRIETPMALHTEMLPNSRNYVAILYGPVVLAGKLGMMGLTEHDFTRQALDDSKMLKISETPLIVGSVSDIVSHLQPEDGKPLTFLSKGLIKPRDVRMVPFYKLFNERYAVYWHVLDEPSWKRQMAAAQAEQALVGQLEANTIDDVRPQQAESESSHQLLRENSGAGVFQAEGWRDATGWFSYVMHVDDRQPLELACKYWGGDTGPRVFDIIVDGTKIASESLSAKHPAEFYYAAYPIPAKLVQGKSTVTVRFQAQPQNRAGGVFDCRVVKAGTLAAAL